MLPGMRNDQKKALIITLLLLLLLSTALTPHLAQADEQENQPAAVMTFLPENMKITPYSPAPLLTPTQRPETGRLTTRLAATLFLLCGTIGMLGAGILIAAIIGRVKTNRPTR